MIRLGCKKAKTTTATFHSYVATETHKNELQSEMEKKTRKEHEQSFKSTRLRYRYKSSDFFSRCFFIRTTSWRVRDARALNKEREGERKSGREKVKNTVSMYIV